MTAECPDPECLVAYLIERAGDRDRARIDAHLLECDRCTEMVMVMHQRWRRAEHIAVPVPASVTTAVAPAQDPVRLDRRERWSTGRERLLAVTRLPVLMPTAFAAGAVIMLLVQQISWQPSGPLTRAVPLEQTLRVRTAIVRVHAAPDSRTPVLAELPAGTVIEVHDQQEKWYRVALPDGREGWVEQAGLD